MTEDRREERASWVKIVATLGPATSTAEQIEQLLVAGVDVVRMNFSHGTQAEHAERISLVRAISERLGRHVAILQDLQGPKIRIGELEGGGPVQLVDGAQPRRSRTRAGRRHGDAGLDDLPAPARAT